MPRCMIMTASARRIASRTGVDVVGEYAARNSAALRVVVALFPEGERANGEAPTPTPRWEKSAARREAERLCRLATSMSRRLLPGERKDACAEEENPVGRLESPKSFRGEGDGEGDGDEWGASAIVPG